VFWICIISLCSTGVPAARAQDARGLQVADLARLQSVGDAELSPDASRIAYSISYSDKPGRPYSRVRIMTLATRQSTTLGADGVGSSPRWSPDGRSIAYFGRDGDRSGLMIASADGRDVRFLAAIQGTNHSLPSARRDVTWSPDGRQIAFLSAVPGPEVDAGGDPIVITRYLYKPTASEGLTRFDDNRRLHIFVADVQSGAVRQLTDGDGYEHSIEWSPRGDEILFVANRDSNPDQFFNYDVFTVKVADGQIRRLTQTKSAEYDPVWSPDGSTIAFRGTTRPLTSSETTMEDTHVWVMKADGTNRRDLGAALDARQGTPRWAPDGRSVYATAQERGSVHLYRFPLAGGKPQMVVGDTGSIRNWSIGKGDVLAYALATPGAPSELYLRTGQKASALTSLNAALLADRRLAAVEPFTFRSFDGTEVEAFLTRPLGMAQGKRHPLIVAIHGGPHGQQGPAFNEKAQVYASHGYATLMVNYRGSTGYGQKFTDAIFKDQNGGEAKDVLAGVDAALERFSWLDSARLGVEGGSYGGQLTNWLITQTPRFKAAIPMASISNLVSFNYMSYYHDYLAVEFGAFPHEGALMDTLWARSPLRYVARVRTPTLFLHGENDNDVPIAEAEQYYIALKDVGVETVMVRYPREGHGVRETAHVADVITRSIGWYDRHFSAPAAGPAHP
jgi:dipeptidyl aminopeptidase/acylaminoacyl peptidase